MDQDNEKNVISIPNVNIDKFFKAFSFKFIFNGTHIKCQNNEKWPQQWRSVPDDYIWYFQVFCATSNFPAVNFNAWTKRNITRYDK